MAVISNAKDNLMKTVKYYWQTSIKTRYERRKMRFHSLYNAPIITRNHRLRMVIGILCSLVFLQSSIFYKRERKKRAVQMSYINFISKQGQAETIAEMFDTSSTVKLSSNRQEEPVVDSISSEKSIQVTEQEGSILNVMENQLDSIPPLSEMDTNVQHESLMERTSLASETSAQMAEKVVITDAYQTQSNNIPFALETDTDLQQESLIEQKYSSSEISTQMMDSRDIVTAPKTQFNKIPDPHFIKMISNNDVIQTKLENIDVLTESLGSNAQGVNGILMDKITGKRRKKLESLKNSLPAKYRKELWARDFPYARQDDDCHLADMDLFMPIHHNDGPLSSALFNSIERVFPCFGELIIVIPPESEFMIPGSIPSYAKVFIVPEPISSPDMGYIAQQIVKLYVDKFSKAKRVLILEADLVMKAWIDSCFLGVDTNGNYNGKVRTYCTKFEDGGEEVWKKGIEHAIGVGNIPTMDCTVNSPFLYHVEIFPQLRQFIQDKHQKPIGKFIEDYYAGHNVTWSKENLLFSEFNILNNFMIQHRPDLSELVMPRVPNIWMRWSPSLFWSADKSWMSQNHCSAHLSDPEVIPRNYNQRNPKLSSYFFNVAYHEVDNSIGMKFDGRTRIDFIK